MFPGQLEALQRTSCDRGPRQFDVGGSGGLYKSISGTERWLRGLMLLATRPDLSLLPGAHRTGEENQQLLQV